MSVLKPAAFRAVAVLVAVLAASLPRSAPAATSAPQSPPSSFVCPLAVARVTALDTTKTTYAFWLRTPLNTQAVSGRITAYANDRRYTLPFESVDAFGSADAENVKPVLFRFAAPTTIDSAYISWLGGHEPGPCEPFSPWSATQTADQRVLARTVDPAGGTKVTAAPPGELEKPPVCASPSRDAAPATPAPAPTADDDLHGKVQVEVMLDPAGHVVHTTIVKSDEKQLNERARAAAMQTTFTPQTYRCRATAGSSVLVVEF